MKREEIRICVLRVGGTNCDAETSRSFKELGVQSEVVHVNELISHRRRVLEYDSLVFPGGFSYGDYVRAGAIWAKWLVAKMGKELETFVEDQRPILGICNGFQVLVEAGLLPAFEGITLYPEAALATNHPPGYNCRWISLRHDGRGKCAFTWKIPNGKLLRMPVAHGEGSFMFARGRAKQNLEKLYENDQLVFRYCTDDGKYAQGAFPTNPNGSFHDIAGVCNPDGTVFGLMPHPERAFYWWQKPEWTRQDEVSQYGDGKLIFESLIGYLEKKA